MDKTTHSAAEKSKESDRKLTVVNGRTHVLHRSRFMAKMCKHLTSACGLLENVFASEPDISMKNPRDADVAIRVCSGMKLLQRNNELNIISSVLKKFI